MSKLLLHVGTPKTGTSYLQDVLFHNRRTLLQHGIRYPADRFDSHFLAALDLMRLPWGGLEREAVGAWDALAAQVRAWPGTTIISHEILAAASRAQVQRALESFGDTELHVLVSARDLIRQVPAEWQENVKHRATLSYAAFLRRIQHPENPSRIGAWFWSVQDLPQIIGRWAADLPPERVHVITVPPSGSPRDLLWSRFEEAFGLRGLPLETEAERANPSLGAAETRLLRQVNRDVNKVLDPDDYRPLVRELLAHQTLSRRRDTPRLRLPAEVVPWAQQLSASWVRDLQDRGVTVHGDLTELLGTPPTGVYVDPDRAPQRLVNRAAVDAIRALLQESTRLRHVEADLHGQLQAKEAELRRAYARPTYQLRQRTVQRLETGPAGRAALAAYRVLRGRNSRSA